jgi:acyl phosphate:glycerol-3-phosphate acyltransferase
MLELGLKIFLSYLLGSVNGALLIGYIKGVDIRESGSGNAGGTNALRTQGKAFAAGVMAIDILKGVIPPLFFPLLVLPGVALDESINRDWLTYSCGLAAVIGHCYPIWFGFKGGKGAATALGVVAAAAPILLVPAFFAAGLVMPIFVAIMGSPFSWSLFGFTLLLGMFVLYTHRSNVQRFWSRQSSVDVKPWIDTGRG